MFWAFEAYRTRSRHLPDTPGGDTVSAHPVPSELAMSPEAFEADLTRWCEEAPEGAEAHYKEAAIKMRACFYAVQRSPSNVDAKVLDLSEYDQLTSLPDILAELKTLEKINLSGCAQLKALPASLSKLKALGIFNLLRCAGLSNTRQIVDTLPSTVCVIEEEDVLSALPKGLLPKILEQGGINELGAAMSLVNSACRDQVSEQVTALTLETPEDLTKAIQTGRYKHIKQLSLRGRDFTNSDLQALCQAFPELTSLNVSECVRLTNLAPLAGLKALTTLNLSQCEELTNLVPLAGLTALTSLNGSCQIICREFCISTLYF